MDINQQENISLSKLAQQLLISLPTASRLIQNFEMQGLVLVQEGLDKREKYLSITDKGKKKIQSVDDFSTQKIIRAFQLIPEAQQKKIIESIELYAHALEKSRVQIEQIKIRRLTTSRTLRTQIVTFIELIQKDEFHIPITPETNVSVYKAEESYCFNGRCNFWYATDNQGKIIGTIGMEKIDEQSVQLKKFFVSPQSRGIGLAHQLWQTLKKNALKQEFKQICLGTVDVLKGAQKFYQKAGFKPIKREALPKNFDICPLDTCFYRANLK